MTDDDYVPRLTDDAPTRSERIAALIAECRRRLRDAPDPSTQKPTSAP